MTERYPYTAPFLDGEKFHCPRCQTYATQSWDVIPWPTGEAISYAEDAVKETGFKISRCLSCSEFAMWFGDKLVVPTGSTAPPPNPDMPEHIKKDYDEASEILHLSPRGAAALLRLAIQKICKHLGKPGKVIYEDIRALVDDGLDIRVQKAFDIIRVVGNEAVHPGELNDDDDTETVGILFVLFNSIVHDMISRPKELDSLYQENIPAAARDEIAKRDSKDDLPF